MKKHSSTAGPIGLRRVRSLLAFRHQNPVARLISMIAAFALSALFVVGVGVVTAPAQAASPCPRPGGFEIDGDMTAATCDPPGDDWGAHTLTPAGDVDMTTQGGTYSTAGKDDDNPSTWVSSGSTPDKTNFERAYATSKTVDIGGGVLHYFVYVAWERSSTTGTQGYAIEIDNAAANTGADGTPQPNRSHGTAVVYISSQGAKPPTFDSACTFTSQATYGQTCSSAANPNVDLAFNTATIADPLAGTSQVASSFFEVGIDVTGLTGITPSCPGADANSVYLRSITGQTHNGNLKGYMAPLEVAPNSTCVAPTVTTQTQQNAQIDGLDVVAPGTNQHDVATVTGTAAHPAPTGSVTFSLCGPTASPANCTTGGQTGGTKPLVQHASNSTAQSNDVAPETPGWYCWRAAFTPSPVNGSNPFLPVTATDKTNECFKVAHATPSIATISSAVTASDAADHSVGFTALDDTATLSNVYPGADLSGQNVSFSLYRSDSAPTANDCTADQLVSGPVDAPLTQVDNTTWEASPPAYAPTAADGPGFYTWIATYNGDPINDGDAGACTDANETQELVGPTLTLSKGTPHSTITAGEDVVYDIDVANVGKGTASGVVVTDVLPTLTSGATWTLAASSDDSCSIADGTGTNAGHQVVTCTIGQLAPSDTTQIAEVSATTTAADCGPISNTAVLTADPDVTQEAGPIVVTVKCPHLTLAKVHDAASVDVGNPIGFSVTVTNDGEGSATGVLLKDVLPIGPGITWTIDPDPTKTHGVLTCSIADGTGADDGHQVLTCTGTLPEGATQAVHVTSPTEWTGSGETEVNSCLGGTDQTGVYDNTAHVTAGNITASPSPASASEAVLCPDLDVTKTEDAAAVNAGTAIGFTIVASNTGSGSATGALVEDVLPSGVTWSIDSTSTPKSLDCSVDDGTGANLGHQVLTCTGTLAAGASQTVHVTAATSFEQCGTYDNTATLTAGNTPQSPDDTASTEVLCADVVVHKAADDDSVSVGSDIGFTVDVTNDGGGEALGVSVEDPLPTGEGINWSIDSSTGPLNCSIADGTGANLGHQVLTCTGDLAANGDADGNDVQSVHVVSGTVWNADLNSCGTYDNTATLTWDNGPETPISSNEASEDVLCPDLTFVKTADDLSVSAGTDIGFTIAASNAGPGTATSVTLHDSLPAGGGVNWAISPAYAGPGTCEISGAVGSQVLDCSFGDLPAAETSVSVHVLSTTTFQSCAAYPNTAVLHAGNRPQMTANATTTVLCPNVAFTKSADAASVNAGQQIGFTVTATNNGAGKATGVVINDPLPAGSGVDWIIVSGPANCSIQGTPPNETLHCNAVDLASGASESVHVVSATGNTSCATYPNVATLAVGNAPGLTANAGTQVVNCVVVSPPKQQPHPHVLPNTGGPNGWVAAGGFALLLAGGALVAGDLRRKRRS